MSTAELIIESIVFHNFILIFGKVPKRDSMWYNVVQCGKMWYNVVRCGTMHTGKNLAQHQSSAVCRLQTFCASAAHQSDPRWKVDEIMQRPPFN